MSPILVVAIFACGWGLVWLMDRLWKWHWTTCLAMGCWWLTLGIWRTGDSLTAAACNAAIAGWLFHLAWKRRPPRKRRPSKVLGRVRDLGHKLAVSHG